MRLDPMAPRGEQMASLPAKVRWKADNYNHLLEQPTLFYAVAIVLALVGRGDGVALYLAWAYVGLRVVHSLIQTLVNRIDDDRGSVDLGFALRQGKTSTCASISDRDDWMAKWHCCPRTRGVVIRRVVALARRRARSCMAEAGLLRSRASGRAVG
jgi:hypothetical protein